MLNVLNADGSTETGSLMDDIVHEGARRLLVTAREAEVNAYITELGDQRDAAGQRLMVRNATPGNARGRRISGGEGAAGRRDDR
ncbi:hypothetical protein OG407_16660 [Streptomyces sp. NBC_01515]|uniref:hypothetical protein n=1 Tax=Streptomyces sp. NBC_01515 TaxID=2903890 RepID=UPI003864DB4B